MQLVRIDRIPSLSLSLSRGLVVRDGGACRVEAQLRRASATTSRPHARRQGRLCQEVRAAIKILVLCTYHVCIYAYMRRWWEVRADATMLLVVCVRVCVQLS